MNDQERLPDMNKSFKQTIKALLNKRIVRKYVYNNSFYVESRVFNYKGVIQVVLIDSELDTYNFSMSRIDAKELAKQINKAVKNG